MMRRYLDMTSNKRVVIFMAVAVAVLFAHSALAIPPTMLPGFPMRAGPVVMLMWGPVPGATNYKVMRRAEGGTWEKLAEQPAPPFNDPAADNTVTYEYQIIPVVNGADGDPSAIAKLQGVKKLAPPEFSGNRGEFDNVQLRWNPVKGATFFNLYRAEGKEDATYSLLGSVQETKYSDAGVEPEKTYFYQITAVDMNSVESARSKPAKVVTPAKPKEVKKVTEVTESWEKVNSFYGEEGYELKTPSAIAQAPDGSLHVVDFKSIQVLDREGNFLRRYGFNENENWGRPGNIYIDDARGEVLVSYYADGAIRVFALGNGEWKRTYTYKGYTNTAGVEIKPNPNAVALDKGGNVYIADGVLRQLVVLGPNTTPPYQEVARVGRPSFLYEKGKDPLPSDLPSAGAVGFNPYDGRIYVGEKTSAFIKVFDPAKVLAVTPDRKDGERVCDVEAIFGGTGAQPYNFSAIGNFIFVPSGEVHVVDGMNNNLKTFKFNPATKEFEYVKTWIGVEEVNVKKKKMDFDYIVGCTLDGKANVLYCASGLLNEAAQFHIPK
jgi:hypothetical protein